MELKILLIGDSFSAATTKQSWVSLLNHNITNISSCGSSEYRVIKKLLNSKIEMFDHIIIVHTSPYRIYTEFNPLHQHSNTHKNCDLLYQDAKDKTGIKFADNVCWWFENIFDLQQADLVHQLLINHSFNIIKSIPSTHITFFENVKESKVHNLSHIYHNHPGDINHMDVNGNQLVANYVCNIL
jgi:hypothetical protein